MRFCIKNFNLFLFFKKVENNIGDVRRAIRSALCGLFYVGFKMVFVFYVFSRQPKVKNLII